MNPRIGMIARILAIFLAQPLMLFWGWFALASYPWIVPADHDQKRVEAYAGASVAGFCLLCISALGVLIATGFFGNREVKGWLVWSIFGGLAVITPCLYPRLEWMQLSELRVAAQVSVLIEIFLALIGLKMTRIPARS